MIGIRKPMPRVLGDEYRSALLERVTSIVQNENSAAFQNIEGFVHLQVSVDRNSCTGRHLLGPQGEIVGACGRADLDKDLAMVTKMNELFAFGGAEHISLWRCGLSPGHASPQYSADADAPQPTRKDRRFCSSAIMTISYGVRRFAFQDNGSCTGEGITERAALAMNRGADAPGGHFGGRWQDAGHCLNRKSHKR